MTTTTRTLLIVDDDVALRTAFSRMLGHSGYNVVTATGSPEVIDLIAEHRPGAILLDNHMPGTTGIDLIRLIRRRWPIEELPVVLISGSSMQGEIDLAMQAGANDFRRKPVEFADLISTVQALFEPATTLPPIEQGTSS